MPIKNQINREAKGFLDFFRAKVGGQGPLNFGDNVQPTVDVGPFVASGLIKGFQVSASGGPGTVATQTVPADEAWLMYGISSWISDTYTLPGEQGWLTLTIGGLRATDGSAVTAVLGHGQIRAEEALATAVLYTDSVQFSPGSPMILSPGMNIQAGLTSSSGSSAIGVSGVYALMKV